MLRSPARRAAPRGRRAMLSVSSEMTMTSRSPATWPAPEALDDAARRLYELSALYEVARQLLGAPNAVDVASRVVLSAVGSLGARSGALLLAQPGGALLLAYGTGVDPES